MKSGKETWGWGSVRRRKSGRVIIVVEIVVEIIVVARLLEKVK